MNELDTKIDDRCRTGCLTGMVKAGERYAVRRVSPVEVHLLLLENASMPKPRLGKRHGRTVLIGGRKLLAADVQKELENFP